MITASDLELRAGSRVLLADVTLRVQPGDRIGLVGRNGAGKTTTLRSLAGVGEPYGGAIRRTGPVGYLPQDPREGDLEVTWALEGPDATTPAALIRLLAGETAPEPRSVAGNEARASLEPILGFSLSDDALLWLADPARADAPDAAAVFDVPRTPILDGLRRALERAAASDEPQTDR